MKISVVIPCYNSEKSIAEVVSLTKDELLKLGYEYEFILVNDYSRDNTFNEIKNICAKDYNVKGINLSKNFGQRKAIFAGLSYTTGNLILCMDDDLQTHPSQISLLIDKLNEGFDIVYATYKEKKHSFIRNLGSKFMRFSVRVLSQTPKNFRMSSFWIAKKFVIDNMKSYKGPYPNLTRSFLGSTSSFGFVQVKHFDRKYGTSNYSFKALIKLWTSVLDTTIVPLRFATYFGMISSFFGVLSAFLLIIRKIINPDIAIGWTSTISLLLILVGIILFILGIMGEYIGKIYMSVCDYPQYIIRDKINVNIKN